MPEAVRLAAALQELQKRPWHGNVRELRNAIEHASVIARGRPLDSTDFPPPQIATPPTDVSTDRTLDSMIESWARHQLEASSDEVTDLHDRMLAATEPALLRLALEQTGGNRAAAAHVC